MREKHLVKIIKVNPINRRDLLGVFGFLEDRVPAYDCPNCQKGVLQKERLTQEYLKSDFAEQVDYVDENGQEHSVDLWEFSGAVQGIFSMLLLCSNKFCKSQIFSTGKFVNEEFSSDDDDFFYTNFGLFFYPEYFTTAIPLFKLNHCTLPKELESILNECFKLFWIDSSSCVNRIRALIELSLDKLNVPRENHNKKGKLIQLKLNDRIERFLADNTSRIFPEINIKDVALALKHIGNHGSHSNDISRSQAFDAIEILELFFTIAFYEPNNRIVEIIRQVNEKKGPINSWKIE